MRSPQGRKVFQRLGPCEIEMRVLALECAGRSRTAKPCAPESEVDLRICALVKVKLRRKRRMCYPAAERVITCRVVRPKPTRCCERQ